MRKIKNSFILITVIAGFLSCNDSSYGNDGSYEKMDIGKSVKQLEQKSFKYSDIIDIWKGEAIRQFNLSKKIDDFKFSAIYKPYSVLVMEETENMNDVIADTFKQKTAVYNSMHFINFSIQNDVFKNELLKLDIEDNQAYYDRISYYSFSSKNEAYIVEDTDTLQCSFVNFERTYEANPGIMLNFSFTRKSKASGYKKLKFVFEDKIFNKGKLVFNFDPQPILLLNYLKPLS